MQGTLADHEKKLKELYELRHADAMKLQEGFSELKLMISELKGSLKNGTFNGS